MAYFADLTPYAYFPASRFIVQHDALNVGWLDSVHPFDMAIMSTAFRDRLRLLVSQPVNLCRGSHGCWCGKAQGNGEIRVTDAAGQVYAAPVLVLHYVTAHDYLPPEGFIDAVMRHTPTEKDSPA